MSRSNYRRSTIKDRARERGFNSVQDMLEAEVSPTSTPTDPNFAFCVSCLNFNGAQDSTTFTDATGRTWTAGVNAKLSRQGRKYGSAGLFLDGVSHIETANSADFNFPGDFWLEGWFYRFDTTPRAIFSNYQNSANGISVELNSTGKLDVNLTGDGVDLGGSITLPKGEYFHWAIGRSGTACASYVDGVQDATFVSGASLSSTAVAALGRLGSLSADFNLGFIGGFRAYKGLCLHTASFSPPSGPFPEA